MSLHISTSPTNGPSTPLPPTEKISKDPNRQNVGASLLLVYVVCPNYEFAHIMNICSSADCVCVASEACLSTHKLIRNSRAKRAQSSKPTLRTYAHWAEQEIELTVAGTEPTLAFPQQGLVLGVWFRVRGLGF